MKKLIIITLILFSFSSVSAQKKDVFWGVKGGLILPNIINDYLTNSNSIVGFQLGALVETPISKKYKIQPELLVSTHVNKDKFITYLDLPIVFKYHVYKGASIEAGPQVGYLLFERNNDNIDNDFKNFDYGLNLGVGHQLKSNYFLQFRYNLGLSNILGYNGFDNTNAIIQVSVGYKFN